MEGLQGVPLLVVDGFEYSERKRKKSEGGENGLLTGGTSASVGGPDWELAVVAGTAAVPAEVLLCLGCEKPVLLVLPITPSQLLCVRVLWQYSPEDGKQTTIRLIPLLVQTTVL